MLDFIIQKVTLLVPHIRQKSIFSPEKAVAAHIPQYAAYAVFTTEKM